MSRYFGALVSAAVLLLGAGQSFAATALAVAKIPVEFTAGGNKLAAGRYEILLQDAASGVLIVRNAETGKSVVAMPITRIAKRDDDKTLLILDKTESDYTLSEIHVAGSDGYLLEPARGKHTHTIVQAEKGTQKD